MELVGTLMAFCVAAVGLCSGLMDSGNSTTFNVVDYGAVGDGKTNDAIAFGKAWGALCKSGGSQPTLLIPAGKTFLLTPVNFQGGCKSNTVTVQVLGNIVAPSSLSGWPNRSVSTWISFSNVNALTVTGSGEIHGQGSAWWNKTSPAEDDGGLASRPTAFRIANCNGVRLSGLRHFDPPRNHISINGCQNVSISNLHITAPGYSPNTDGIDIAGSNHVNIQDSFVSTGDDCIAINGNSSYINISGISCGPGHGISVGSLGKNGIYETVEEVLVRLCTFTQTTNGARIKTWQGGRGYVRNINFEQLTFVNVGNPIIIDQYYCQTQSCPNQTSAVKISEVTYRNINGSSNTPRAIDLSCSQSQGCTNIVMDQVHLFPSIAGKKIFAYCYNAIGTERLTVPNATCLAPVGLFQ